MEFFAKSPSTGITAHITDSKKGSCTLFLLHGYLETMYIWSELAEALEKKYRVITVDLPGHGISGTDPECNSTEFCADFVKDLMDAEGIDKCVIGGHSMGGYVAMNCIYKYPERFEKMIIFNSNPWPDAPEKQLARERQIQMIKEGQLMKIAEESIPHFYKNENLRACDYKIKETVQLCDMHDPNGICASLRGLSSRPDRREDLKKWTKPALWFYGDSDLHMDADRIGFMKGTYPSFTHVTVKDSGHMSFIEQPDKVLEEVERFMAC